MTTPLVRRARPGDVAALVALSARVQARLAASGSLQRFGPIPESTMHAYVDGGHAYLLAAPDRTLGGVLVRPETAETLPPLATFGLADPGLRLWWLTKLMIEPDEHGRGLGAVLLAGALADVAARGARTVGLDCWAGNDTLRAFYARAGFVLHGVFPEDEHEIAVFTWHPPGVSPAPPSPRPPQWGRGQPRHRRGVRWTPERARRAERLPPAGPGVRAAPRRASRSCVAARRPCVL